MQKERILIVEDELLVADLIRHYVETYGHEVCGIAVSFEQAIDIIEAQRPSIVLLDIKLNGKKTGIDIAYWLRTHMPSIPFLFLTSQFDLTYMAEIKKTFPAGYISKPIAKQTLLAMIEIALNETSVQQITLNLSGENKIINVSDILFLQAEHVYVHVFLKDTTLPLLVRQPLTQLQERLPTSDFLKVHRSYVINVKHISGWSRSEVHIGPHRISVSKSFLQALKPHLGQ